MNDNHASRTADVPLVLCIDDDPTIVETLSLQLKRYDVDVMGAYHGTQALWMAANSHPDLIITDLRMPLGQGDYVVKCLRAKAHTTNIPVIVLTGQHNFALEAELQSLPAVKFFHKPVSFDVLTRGIREFIPLQERRWEEDEILTASKDTLLSAGNRRRKIQGRGTNGSQIVYCHNTCQTPHRLREESSFGG